VNAFQWKNGFQDHWLDKHTSEEEKVRGLSKTGLPDFSWYKIPNNHEI
jgi:hypothetical protein